MRLPRFRLTIAWMMVVVAVVALIVGYEAMRRKRAAFLLEVAHWTKLKMRAVEDVEDSVEAEKLSQDAVRDKEELQKLYRRVGEEPTRLWRKVRRNG